MQEKSPKKRNRKLTSDTGVYQEKSTVRRHNGKSDVCYYVTYNEGGRKIWEKIGWRSEGISQATAKTKRQELMHQKNLGISLSPNVRKITWGQAWAEYEQLHLSNTKVATLYKAWANEHILPIFGKIPLMNIGTHDIAKFRALLESKVLHMDKERHKDKGKQYSPQTVKHILSIIRQVFNKSVAWGLYVGPIPIFEMPDVDAERLRFLTAEEAGHFFKVLWELEKNHLWHDITLLALYAGLRLENVLSLRGRQINLAHDFIDVVESKTGSYRAFFPPIVKDMLLRRMPEDLSGLIFPSPVTGGVIWNVGKPWKKAVEICKLNEGITDPKYLFVFHSLRHTYASWLLQKGESLEMVGQGLNHKDPRMTKRYAKFSLNNIRNAVKGIPVHTSPTSCSGDEIPELTGACM